MNQIIDYMDKWCEMQDEANAQAAFRDLDDDFEVNYDFFKVLAPIGYEPVRDNFADFDAALGVAERLADLNPGQEFFVMKTVAVSTQQAVTTTIYL